MKCKLLLTAITFLMALSSTALADTGYVTIGTGTSSSNYVPYGNGDKYSTTQSIYTAAEIGIRGTIKTIAYNVGKASSFSTTSVQIYMGHTSKSSFSSSSNYENVSNMTLVYSGSPTLAQTTGWEELTLTTPFAYNGTDNLIIVVGRQSDNNNRSARYYCSSTTSTQCLRRSSYDYSYYGDPSSTGNYLTSYRADVRLGFEAKKVGQFSYIISSETTSTVCGTTATGVVNIPASVTIDGKSYVVTAILGGTFKDKTDITSVAIPSSVTSIGNDAFYGCSALTSINIPSSVTCIGNDAFRGCSALTSINIPSSVTSIGNDAFTGCTGIKEVKIEDGTETLSLGYKSNSSDRDYYYGLFKDCPIETLYLGRNLSYSIHSNNSFYPGNGAPFEYQSEMKSVTIGKDVTKIGDYAFYECTGLTGSITIPSSVTSIGSYAFSGCSGLTSLTIPSNVTSIGDGAFGGCSGLTSITIPSSVTSIGSSAFYGCTGLTSITIPSSVTSIGSYAFYGCTGKLIVNCNIGNGSSSDYGWFYNSMFSFVEISKDVTEIGN